MEIHLHLKTKDIENILYIWVIFSNPSFRPKEKYNRFAQPAVVVIKSPHNQLVLLSVLMPSIQRFLRNRYIESINILMNLTVDCLLFGSADLRDDQNGSLFLSV